MNVTLGDFQPFNTWYLELDGEKWEDGSPKHLIDRTTGQKYWNESEEVVRFKCVLLTVGTLFVHAIAGIINIAYRTLKLFSLYHFWESKEGEKSYDFKARLEEAGIDLLRIFSEPLAILGLELAAIYGIYRPYDGRKLYASIERAQYNHYVLAPCFQPDPKKHFLGGDPNKKNAF